MSKPRLHWRCVWVGGCADTNQCLCKEWYALSWPRAAVLTAALPSRLQAHAVDLRVEAARHPHSEARKSPVSASPAVASVAAVEPMPLALETQQQQQSAGDSGLTLFYQGIASLKVRSGQL